MSSNTAESITVKGRQVTRADVEAVMAECDSMGQAAFLKHYGFGVSQTYWLRGPKTHRPYPSKAILAVAAQCTKVHGYTGQFFGGAAHTVNSLIKLGFKVRTGSEPVKSAGVEAYRAAAIAAGFDDPTPGYEKLAATGVTPVAIFASGSNTAKVIKGMAAVRMDVGVAAPHISRVCKSCKKLKVTSCKHSNESALVALSGTDIAVFCDSGAFSEVDFPSGVPTIVKPISHAQWTKRLDLYERLGSALGEQAWVVAPDCVAHQKETLERMAKYAPQLAKIADTGAIVILPVQKGAMSQANFWKAALKASGLAGRTNVVAGMPCKKGATTPAELIAFVAEAKPDHVHCLGLGPTNPKIAAYMAAFAGTTTTVSLDACWITANAAKKTKKAKERRYTKAQRIVGKVFTTLGIASLALKLEVALACCLGAPIPAAIVTALSNAA